MINLNGPLRCEGLSQLLFRFARRPYGAPQNWTLLRVHLIHLMLCLENTNYVAIIRQTFGKKVGTDFQLLNCCVFVGGSGVKVLVGHVGQMIFCASLFPANESDAGATVIRRLPLLLFNKL